MKRLLRFAGILAGFILLLAVAASWWLYFYTADLPPVSQLALFNPSSEAEARISSCDGSGGPVRVVAADKVGKYTVAALAAAEGQPYSRSPYVAVFAAPKKHGVGYEIRLARTLACFKQSHLSRELQELRIANQINRRFPQSDVVTIYLNRVYFGDGEYGVEGAARKYYRKSASALTVDETALLVGLIRSPNHYSPTAHRERAMERRNEVIDQMVAQGSLSPADADVAKARPVQTLE